MPGRPKILLTNFHLGTGGGHRTYLLSLLRGPLRDQFDLALACPASSSINVQARASGCLVFDQIFPGSLKNLFQVIASIRDLERIHRQFPFDLIHCNGSRDHWIAIYWKIFYRRAAKIVRSRHAVKIIGSDIFHAWANNRATALNIFVSRGMIPLCEPPGALHLENARMIPNGIDTEYFAPRPKDDKLAAQLRIAPADFVVGSNAGLGTHKRADLMLKAITEFPDRERIKILLLGEPRSGDLYLQIASRMGLEKNVICPGMIDDVRPYLSLLDLGFVLSDSIETSSYAAKEMIAMGVPLVCTRYSGLPENVDEGKSGFLIEPGDLEGLQKCLTSFLALSETERASLRAHARDKAVREFSKERQMESIAQAYREICG
jgi:L-malate glycosyltransferase